MRVVMYTLVLLCSLRSDVQGQVPERTWAALLQGCVGDCGDGKQAHLSKEQAKVISRFVQLQFRRDPQFWESAPHGNKVCSPDVEVDWDKPEILDCLNITPMPVELPNVFYVSAQRGFKNPSAWLLKIKNGRALDLVGSLVSGTPDILPQTHSKAHDIALTGGMGASVAIFSYLRFDGTRYRTLGTHTFTVCSELPGHSHEDQRWCFEDGRPVGGS